MKICAIICEYNPFHNGHLYQIQLARSLSKADAILCIMSGNFVQRGDAAIMDKFTRAKHAVLSGVDAVIELPVPFATSNAELFAKGAISILNSIPNVTTLCFGAEQADKNAFIEAAKVLNNEPTEISQKIKALTEQGLSFAKARAEAFKGYIPCELLTSPNNILGLEYTKALLTLNSKIEILPILRQGSGYSDLCLKENFSSASAIRAAIANGKEVERNLPSYVINDLPKGIENKLDTLKKYALLSHKKEEIASICDCTEGLENAFKKAALSKNTLEENLTSARYTSSRIRRISLQNLLGISHSFIKECLSNTLYLRVLAIKKESKELLSVLDKTPMPLLIRAHDEDKLQGIKLRCYEKDIFAEQIYSLLYKTTLKKNIFIDN